MISVIENFINDSEVQTLLSFCKGLRDDQFEGHGFWENRVVPFNHETPEVKALAEDTTRKIREAIYEVSGKRRYPDCRNFVRWLEGQSMEPHADGDYPDGSFSWRLYGAILYLNDDFDGGEIYFPNHDLVLKPKPGTLVFFPGHLPFLHGVNEVTNGIRYTFASFWTKEPERSVMKNLDD